MQNFIGVDEKIHGMLLEKYWIFGSNFIHGQMGFLETMDFLDLMFFGSYFIHGFPMDFLEIMDFDVAVF